MEFPCIQISLLKYKSFFCEFGHSTTYKFRKGTAVPSLVSAGFGGVCVVACCIVQETKVFPESPRRPAGVLLSMIGRVGVGCTRWGQKRP